MASYHTLAGEPQSRQNCKHPMSRKTAPYEQRVVGRVKSEEQHGCMLPCLARRLVRCNDPMQRCMAAWGPKSHIASSTQKSPIHYCCHVHVTGTGCSISEWPMCAMKRERAVGGHPVDGTHTCFQGAKGRENARHHQIWMRHRLHGWYTACTMIHKICRLPTATLACTQRHQTSRLLDLARGHPNLKFAPGLQDPVLPRCMEKSTWLNIYLRRFRISKIARSVSHHSSHQSENIQTRLDQIPDGASDQTPGRIVKPRVSLVSKCT